MAARFGFNIDRINELQTGDHKCRATPAFEETENGIERALAEWVDRRDAEVSDDLSRRRKGKSPGRPPSDETTKKNYAILKAAENDCNISRQELADTFGVKISMVDYVLSAPAKWKQRMDDLMKKKNAGGNN